MEILALVGTPKVVATHGAMAKLALMSMAVVGATTPVTDTPGESFGGNGATYNQGKIVASQFGLTMGQGFWTMDDGTRNRFVVGFRVVFKSGFTGTEFTEAILRIGQWAQPAGQYSTVTVQLPFAPYLVGDEGHYIEIIMDARTTKTDVYLDGFKVADFTAWPGSSVYRSAEPSFNLAFTERLLTGTRATAGYVKDIYIGHLADGEEFDPIGGGMSVEQFDTLSTEVAGMTAAAINTWAPTIVTAYSLNDVVKKEYIQTYGDPTPLKSAVAITAMCNSMTTPGFIEVTSDGEVASTMMTRSDPAIRSRVARIDPSKIGNDFVVKARLPQV